MPEGHLPPVPGPRVSWLQSQRLDDHLELGLPISSDHSISGALSPLRLVSDMKESDGVPNTKLELHIEGSPYRELKLPVPVFLPRSGGSKLTFQGSD